ncbi:MAG: LptE family protein [Candidatus Eisenbacteria bacterium]|uniref:LptE family protein n=1 Tax=Eiseniibacteriota bacterium TaxID=2212470 RepID=A0A849SQT0_UNCEI|nr:LptE family protein [Candidatus Eisenbacteria bacterium]
MIEYGAGGTRFGRWLAVASLSLGLASGCAYTTSTALLPAHLKSVAIPVFENGTSEYQIERTLTDVVIERFVSDNHLRIVDEKSADLVIRGRIRSYRNAVFGFNTAANAQEYRVTVGVEVTARDRVKNREMWHLDDLVRTANYYVVPVPGAEATDEIGGRSAALKKIADEILARTVEGW